MKQLRGVRVWPLNGAIRLHATIKNAPGALEVGDLARTWRMLSRRSCTRIGERALLGRRYASSSGKDFRVLVIGGGAGGLSVANQVYNKLKAHNEVQPGQIAIMDSAEFHNYQPGW